MFEKVLYNEMQEGLCAAASYNFRMLDAVNISTNCGIAENGNIGNILGDFRPDIIFMDPARRGEGGKKVFLIEECTPDVLSLKDEVFSYCRHMLLKLSPMADVSMVCDRLGNTCREVHVVATGGECKELLIWMDREWNAEYSVHAVELPGDYPSAAPAVFTFLPSEEHSAIPTASIPAATGYLFEPGKALMKAGAFNLISERINLAKLGKSTHYYTTEDSGKIDTLKRLGKVFEIMSCEPLDKRTIKSAGSRYPKAEVTARNIPMDTDALRKKLGITSGDDAHIFGLKSDRSGNMLLCTKRVL
jgi:hypothetical protein